MDEVRLPEEPALRLELLQFKRCLEALEQKRNEFWLHKLELDTLEKVANREALELLEKLGRLDLLDTLLIISPLLSCTGYSPEDPSEARDCIEFKEWGVLPGWDDESHQTIGDDDRTVPFLQPVQ